MTVAQCERRWRTLQKLRAADLNNPKDFEMADLQIDEEELTRLGIKRVPADIFVWRGYRYSHVRDAIAAAKRADTR
jgi:hypothetical protein